VAELGASVVRPTRRDEPGRDPHLAPVRQRLESLFWTGKDLLTLERHGPVPWPGCASASWRTSSASRLHQPQAPGSGDRVAPWSTTAPEAVGVGSII